MEWLKQYLKSNPHVVISVPTVLCFVQFLTSIFGAFRNGVFDNNTFNQLLSTADGFESVVLFMIMLALKDKK